MKNNQLINKNEKRQSFREQISYRNEIKEEARKEKLAQQLFNGELYTYDLADNEVEEMITYFIKDIEKQDIELQKIKEHIFEMKRKLANRGPN